MILLSRVFKSTNDFWVFSVLGMERFFYLSGYTVMGHTNGWLTVGGQQIFKSWKHEGIFKLKEVLCL